MVAGRSRFARFHGGTKCPAQSPDRTSARDGCRLRSCRTKLAGLAHQSNSALIHQPAHEFSNHRNPRKRGGKHSGCIGFAQGGGAGGSDFYRGGHLPDGGAGLEKITLPESKIRPGWRTGHVGVIRIEPLAPSGDAPVEGMVGTPRPFGIALPRVTLFSTQFD